MNSSSSYGCMLKNKDSGSCFILDLRYCEATALKSGEQSVSLRSRHIKTVSQIGCGQILLGCQHLCRGQELERDAVRMSAGTSGVAVLCHVRPHAKILGDRRSLQAPAILYLVHLLSSNSFTLS